MFLNKVKNNLSGTGLKSTASRIAILNILDKKKSPLDVETIVSSLRNEGLSTDQATVYRILNKFYQKGIIQRIELGEGKYRYEKSDKDHHHLICTLCGKVEDVEDKYMSKLEAEIYKNKGFKVKSHSLEFFGICSNCQN